MGNRLLNLINDLIDYKEVKDKYSMVDYILDWIEDKPSYDVLTGTLDVFEDVELVDEDFLLENIDAILKQMESFFSYTVRRMYEDGNSFERVIPVDLNKYEADENDMLQDNWIDIDTIEHEMEYTEVDGKYAFYGYIPSGKKVRGDISIYY